MRILLATETFLPHVDGIVTRLTNTIANLVRQGDQVMIVTPAAPGTPKDFEGARVLTIPSVGAPGYPGVRLGMFFFPPTVQYEISKFNPEIIHAISPAFTGLGAILAARRRGVPLVESYHVQYAQYITHYRFSPLVPFVWWYLRTVHNLARLNLATSLPMVRELRERGINHMEHWRAGVDAERYHPSKRSHEWRMKLSDGHPDEPLFICVARLGAEKSIDRLVPAMKATPGVRLAIAGDGPARAHLEAEFAGLPVKFMGMLHKENLAAAYASADAFVLPSSTETLGLVALEAMASGIPAVVADRGGLPDLVIDGQTGYLFDPDDPGALTRCLTTLRDDPALRERMAQDARAHAERFTWAQTTRQLRGYYRRVRGETSDLSSDELESMTSD